jgi:transcriptional regulator GlxA family with amidase domain
MLRHTEQSKLTPTDPNPFVLGLASTPQRVRALRGPRVMDARIVRVLEIVARELEKPHSVKLLAAQLRLSPSRFEHFFKKETGQTFKAFVQTVRMKRAKKMLQDPTLRIKEIAAAAGYPDVSNFTHYFRKQYGESPSQSRSPSR